MRTVRAPEKQRRPLSVPSEQAYNDSANVGQAEQERRYAEARTRLAPWKGKVGCFTAPSCFS